MRKVLISAAALALFCSHETWAADSMRCDGRIVSTEALAAEVLAVCGEPAYRDRWLYQAPYQDGYIADTEEWYYNFGPNQLLRILRFRDGHLVDIDTDGYGFSRSPGGACDPRDLVEGLSKYRLLLLCGDPVNRESYNVLAPLHRPRPGMHSGMRNYWLPVFREKWVYNFGSRYLLREVTLENGRVVNVENGNRGFDPR